MLDRKNALSLPLYLRGGIRNDKKEKRKEMRELSYTLTQMRWTETMKEGGGEERRGRETETGRSIYFTFFFFCQFATDEMHERKYVMYIWIENWIWLR